MAYRNGTYVAFHADGTDMPTNSDMKYYNLLKAWTAKRDDDFSIINSHDKASSVQDRSKKATLLASLQERLRNSKNMLLIVGRTTRLDTDWVPFEIEQAVGTYEIPIIAAYTEYSSILAPAKLHPWWPRALAARINDRTARVIHIPFKKEPIAAAIDQFDMNTLPKTALTYYKRECYVRWGLIKA